MSEIILYNGKSLNVVELQYKLRDKVFTEEIVVCNGGVAIIPILPNGNIILVEQYRPALNKITLEIPSGAIEDNETEIESAERELQEETSYIFKSIRQLVKFDVSPGYLTEEITIFVANIETQGKQSLDVDEDIKVLEFSQGEIYKLLQNGSITDSKTLLALTYLFSFDREFKRQR